MESLKHIIPSERQALLVGIIIFILLVSGYCLYQVYFHPLANYPGPRLSKFISARGLYHAWNEDLHLDMWRCHQNYGPIVRYAPNRLIVNTVSGLKDIYGVSSNVQKASEYGRLNSRSSHLITMIDDTEHAARRRLMSRGLSELSIKNIEPKLVNHLQSFLDQLYPRNGKNTSQAAGWGPSMIMSDWCSYLSFDIMAEYIFGVNFDLLRDEEHRHVISDIEHASIRASILMYAPYLYLGRLDKILFRKSIKGRDRYLQMVEDMVAKSLDRSSAEPKYDVFSILVNGKDKTGSPLSRIQIRAQAASLVIAGYDTTATTLCALLFHLAHCPQSYAQLAREIRSEFRHLEEIRMGERLHCCRYLNACLSEVLRISPPVASCLFRDVKHGGATIDGHFIPASYSVGTGIYSIHHNEDYFPSPHYFRPERWLEDTHDGFLEGNTAAWCPFSLGPRSCMGKPLAYWELLVTTASLIWLYDFRASPGKEGQLGGGTLFGKAGRTNPSEFQLYDHVTGGKKGPVLQFRPRSM